MSKPFDWDDPSDPVWNPAWDHPLTGRKRALRNEHEDFTRESNMQAFNDLVVRNWSIGERLALYGIIDEA